MGIDNLVLMFSPWVLLILICIIFLITFSKQQRRDDIQKDFNDHDTKVIRQLAEREKAFKVTTELNAIILETLDFNLAAQRIANAIPQLLGYKTGVLALVDEEAHVLKRVAISETPGGTAALVTLEVPFSDINIDLSEDENFCIRALRENRVLYTTRLYDVLRPVISEKNSDMVQQKMNTKTTLIFPIYSRDNKPYGTFLVSMDKTYEQISDYEHETLKNFVDGIRIALRNASLYTTMANITTELKAANERLKELDVLKNEFVSVASHELRTPMTAIKSYLWMALDGKGGPLTEKQRYYIDRAYLSVDRLIKMVNDMLNISRIESGRLTINIQSVNIDKLVQEVLDDVKPRAQELGIHISLQMDAPPPPVLADVDKVKEVVFNLVGNSLKFTPKDGNVTVSFNVTDTEVEVKVKDSGSGLEAEDIPKLFQKFGLLPGSYVTNQAALGTGLGLFICKSIIELHEGKIYAKSDGRGKGAEFVFSLKIFNEADLRRLSDKFAHDTNNAVELIHSQV